MKPYVPDAWIDESKTKIGYEIPFTRYFYEYKPLRPLEEIKEEIWQINDEIQGLVAERCLDEFRTDSRMKESKRS